MLRPENSRIARHVAALVLALCCLACGPRPATVAGPHIVVILVDDLGVGDVGCYNPDSRIPTPNIDALAAEGMRFRAAYAPSAVCSPSRYALLTGRYAWRTRLQQQIVGRYDPLLIDPRTPTLPAFLREHGYTTACIGKWHLGLGEQRPGDYGEQRPAMRPRRVDYTQPLRPGPNACGFDYFFGAANKPGMYFMLPQVHPQDELSSWFIEDERLLVGERADWDQTQVGPILVRKATEWIERSVAARPERPLFLYFALTAVHAPLHPAALAQGRSGAGTYGDFVYEADWAVGEVRAALERAGIADDTLLVVSSDNGADPTTAELAARFGHRSNLDLRGWKRDIWEGGLRVPLVVRWPGRVAAGSLSDRLVALNDIFATSASAAGLALPSDAAADSFDFADALTGTPAAGAPRQELVLHSAMGTFALRRGTWKYVDGRGSGGNDYAPGADTLPAQLYDLARDPSETRNLLAGEPELAAELAAELRLLRSRPRSRP